MRALTPSRTLINAFAPKAAAVLSTVAALGCGTDAPDHPVVALAPTASVAVPATMHVHVALVSEDVVCGIRPIEPRLYCVDDRRNVIGVFGREGEGPGELHGSIRIRSGADGVLAVLEYRSSQITSFRPDGTLVSEVGIPRTLWGTDLVGERLFGHHLATLDRSRFGDQSRYVAAEVDASTGEIVWERDVADAVRRDCYTGRVGVLNPAGGLVTTACEHEMVFLDHWADTTATMLPSPTYVPTLPSERDMDLYLARTGRIGGSVFRLTDAEKEAYAAGVRDKPLRWHYGGGSSGLRFDGNGRLWAATVRDRDDFSYFDVWVDREYATTVRIRDRLMGYDVLGSTLVALVERKPDRHGIAPYAIDWYDIGGIEGTVRTEPAPAAPQSR